MDRWRHDDPCAGVDDLAGSIKPGLWLNMLVADVAAAVRYQTEILGTESVYRDDAFAIMRHGDSFWMLHADSTYAGHPMATLVGAGPARGAGCEIRLQGCDPDRAADRARAGGFGVMAAAEDKPHGLREAFLVDPDGYVWVPSIAKPEPATEGEAA